MSNLTDYFTEKNLNTGISIFVLVTFIFYILTNFFYPEYSGFYGYADIQFLFGAILGGIFTLKYRKPEQSILKYGIFTGLGGGFMSSVFISLYITVPVFIMTGPNIIFYLLWLVYISLSGIVIGVITGALLGAYYMYKEMRGENEEEGIDDDFYKHLAEK
ncbi:hypothetical protein LCGC14_2020440 [marine sediment metagenome]|uniref:DUF5518 domain-containing protein n=1 Tax=marine sediment metagenome TaxID=412755 RepID=A0A0F9HB04_9ZZZZ